MSSSYEYSIRFASCAQCSEIILWVENRTSGRALYSMLSECIVLPSFTCIEVINMIPSIGTGSIVNV